MRRSPKALCAAILLCTPALFTAANAAVPRAGNVYVVLLENTSYSQALGGSSMPWLKNLGTQYTTATNYYANTHPSIGNYFMLTTGRVISNSDGYSQAVTADNLVRRFLSAGITWKAYAQSLPYAGYTGGDKYPYIKHHNPFAYFSDVRNSSTQKMNIVPFTQFAKDLSNSATPEFSFIIPNNQNNAHDCPKGMSSCSTSQKLRAADDWLKANIAPLLSSSHFQQDGLLAVVFDESSSGDKAYGGGHVAMVLAGPKVRRGYKLTNFYQHQNLLRMASEALGLTSFLGAAASASNLSSVFGSDPSCVANSIDHTVSICAPTAGASYSSPLRVTARATSSTGVNTMAIYLDGMKAHTVSGSNSLDTYISATRGSHRLTVQAWDKQGRTFKSTIYTSLN